MAYVPVPCGPPRRAPLAEGIDGWVVTRYDDVRALLADERFVRNPAEVARLRETAGLSAVHMGGTGRGTTLLHLDPPAHTRVRRAAAPSFTLRRIDAHRLVIEEMAATLVDRCAPSGRADLVCDLATPLAIGVLCHVAGLPPADAARFRPWVRAVHRIDGGSEGGRRTVEAIEAMDRYLAERTAEAPGAGALADVVERSGRGVAGAGLTDDEVIALARDLLVGGYESTANLIAGGLALLLAQPDRIEQVRADPAALAPTVEECLRQVAPFPRLEARYAAEAVNLGGVLIGAGEAVVADIAAANRDPKRFGPADQGEPASPGGHLSFGHGAHHCVGATLARQEATAAFRAVLIGLDEVRLACAPDELVWEPGLSPTLRSLPVWFTPRPAQAGG
jgi:cytochrome P450